MFSQRLRKPLMVGVGLAVFQQITGINAIIYYADKIFAAAGFSTPADQAAATTWAIGGVNVLATFIAVAYVDRFGRRPLLLCGLVGMATSLATVGICFHYMDNVDTEHGGDHRQRPDRGRRHHPGGAGRVHRLVRVLARARRVDGHQRDLPEPGPGPGRRRWPPRSTGSAPGW